LCFERERVATKVFNSIPMSFEAYFTECFTSASTNCFGTTAGDLLAPSGEKKWQVISRQSMCCPFFHPTTCSATSTILNLVTNTNRHQSSLIASWNLLIPVLNIATTAAYSQRHLTVPFLYWAPHRASLITTGNNSFTVIFTASHDINH